MGRNLLIAVLLSAIVVISGCQGEQEQATSEKEQVAYEQEQVAHEPAQVAYKEISPQEALALMEEDPNVILLDVRTEEEYYEKRIPGSVLIPDYDLPELAAQKLPDKDATILVYCRTGRRSEASSRQLIEMGYTRVYDLGGIVDWPYDTVSGSESDQ